jgi:hypothetical protein
MPLEQTPEPGVGGASASRLKGIKPGMEVEDPVGERIGQVSYVHFGESGGSALWSRGPGMRGERLAAEIGAEPVPDVPPDIADRMLRVGYIKIDDKRRFRFDHHYYALPGDIASVDASVVRLRAFSDDLISATD